VASGFPKLLATQHFHWPQFSNRYDGKKCHIDIFIIIS